MFGRGQSVVVGPNLFLSGDNKPLVTKKSSSKGIKGLKDNKKVSSSKRNLLTLVDCVDPEDKYYVQGSSGK